MPRYATKPCWTPPSPGRSNCTPTATCPPDLAALAASLAFGLAHNHPFVDGNNRTAHVCYRTFLALNGATLSASGEDKYVTTLALAEGSLPEADFATWLRQHIRREPGNEIHEKPARYGR